jgi:hypothetical protein
MFVKQQYLAMVQACDEFGVGDAFHEGGEGVCTNMKANPNS